jgi:Xaa-Pro aminopeptidase
MFSIETYKQRRADLAKQIKNGLVLFMGNQDSPMNYPENIYHFRQDSSFLYYWGLNTPNLAAVIDIDTGEEILFGHDFTVDEVVWMGPQPKLKEWGARIGVDQCKPIEDLSKLLESTIDKQNKIHFLPQYRYDNLVTLGKIFNTSPDTVNNSKSVAFIKAVIAQRSIKTMEEIIEIESALEVTYEMQTQAMRLSAPGRFEREVAGIIEGITLTRGNPVSYPVIFTVNGQTLHNISHGNEMQAGDIVINDSGAESDLHYASDITRTFPVSGRFTAEQRDIYNIVLKANMKSIEAVKPGVPFKAIHLNAAKIITQGLKDLGIMQGNVDDAVELGAHALFYPHGLGHMMGLDVHDMENLGEDYVGYDASVKRSDQFGLQYLRLAKKLQPGYVLTVEPGIYFIPELIDQWQADNRFDEFINYKKVNTMRGFGGVRIEDNILVEKNGPRVLGVPIPKTIVEVESLCSN